MFVHAEGHKHEQKKKMGKEIAIQTFDPVLDDSPREGEESRDSRGTFTSENCVSKQQVEGQSTLPNYHVTEWSPVPHIPNPSLTHPKYSME